MSEAPHVLTFHDKRCREVDLAGGKGASLASMTQNGLPVPPGFVITAQAFLDAVDGDALLRFIDAEDLDSARAGGRSHAAAERTRQGAVRRAERPIGGSAVLGLRRGR